MVRCSFFSNELKNKADPAASPSPPQTSASPQPAHPSSPTLTRRLLEAAIQNNINKTLPNLLKPISYQIISSKDELKDNLKPLWTFCELFRDKLVVKLELIRQVVLRLERHRSSGPTTGSGSHLPSPPPPPSSCSDPSYPSTKPLNLPGSSLLPPAQAPLPLLGLPLPLTRPQLLPPPPHTMRPKRGRR